MELTVEGLIGELGLELVCGQETAHAHVRWVHSTELPDPTPWLKGGELLLTTGMQLTGPKSQRELIERLADHEIAGLGFGTGFAHKRLPAALVEAARGREFPLFEVPYELPFIAITERAFARLLEERYELLQRNDGRRRARGGADGASLPRGPAGASAPVRDRRAGGGARVPAAGPERGGGGRGADPRARARTQPGGDPRGAAVRV